jgi:hypothetical protein
MADRIDSLGWNPDPAGNHQLRYHDGATYTQYVCDNGVVGVDAVPSGRFVPGRPPVVGTVLPPVCPRPGTVAPPRISEPPPWIPVEAPVVPASGESRRDRSRLAMTAVVVEALVIAVLGLLLATTRTTHHTTPSAAKPIGSTVAPSGSFTEYGGRVVYSSNFGANDGWNVGSLNTNTTATVLNNQYVVQGWTTVHHVLLSPYLTPQLGISVETSATNYSTGNISFGSGCQSAGGASPALVYQLVAYPDGQWYIEEARVPGKIETLLSGHTSALGAAASLQLTCAISDTTSHTQTTQLVGYINGIQVGAIGDQIDRVDVGGYVPMLPVGSYGPRVSVAFTNIIVRNVSPSEQPQLQRRQLGPGVSVDRYTYSQNSTASASG